MDFQIEVNNTLIDVQEGQTLLNALREHGFKVPTLCHMNQFSPTGACRLCVVEVEGKRDLITSCSYPVEPGMKVKTNSQRVIHARKSLVELLLSNHPDDCLYCERNGNCELQWLAEDMNVKERKYFGKKTHYHPDNSSPSVFRDPAKCVLCSRCVRVCEEVQLVTAIDFIGRGTQTKVNSAFHKGLNVSSCINCGQCLMVCPTGALVDISHLEKVQAAIDNNKQVVFFISPAAMASVAEYFGMKPTGDLEGIIAASLKKMGASQVFNLGVSYDINLKEESDLLIRHIQKKTGMPLLSSECPAWVKYVEAFRPELIPYLSTVKSPQQILGSILKDPVVSLPDLNPERIYTVGIMPCVANKFEASREEMTHKGISEVDAVLTVRELIRLIRAYGIDMRKVPAGAFDEPYQQGSAAAWKMGYSGGKAEAIAWEVFHRLNRSSREKFKFTQPKSLTGRKETKVMVDGQPLGFAWVNGIAEAEAYISQLQEEGRTDIHYIEVTGCPGGCAGGGGQPISQEEDKWRTRKKICQEMEKQSQIKTPGDNPRIEQIYSGNAGPVEHFSELFHTRFARRKVLK